MLRGSRFYCPICERGFRRFLEFGIEPRQNACCPSCGSLERHRLLWLVICNLQSKGIIKSGGKLLHVAPKQCLVEKFRQEYDCISIDLKDEKSMMIMDITAIAFEVESFDAIVCNHVLEHIPDDRKAINELYRVLKPGGWASIQVPITGDVTQEDLSIADPKDRLRLYGEEDHVRCYGRDFVNRLKEAGFEVSLIPKISLFEEKEFASISVDCENEVLIAFRT